MLVVKEREMQCGVSRPAHSERLRVCQSERCHGESSSVPVSIYICIEASQQVGRDVKVYCEVGWLTLGLLPGWVGLGLLPFAGIYSMHSVSRLPLRELTC